ncbi:MAG: type II toxin-antitoxin system VapC family toxin [Gemmatimonadetes bacterium]|nr:type II toxin-antitoxin system VapC family toxin [Gemmatimonadota bacterium]MYA76657.1 type II toxin-antitoxin system VapC family toxin [Gemmatimonadota bacterium]MYG17617.1 type II toxin-antitoxin system VapC family toxin [Gemmatimonadota bacterium]MYH18246.1 type II toxin-antitoxin system VapC family toxin [Gemmatimonadota bacterium]
MNMVIDTSAIIASVMRGPERDALAEAASGHVLIAPGFVRWEVCQALSVMIRQKGIDVVEARRGMEILDNIPLRYVEVDMAQVLSIASRMKGVAADAFLLETAIRYNAPLLTLDRSLGRAAESLGIDVVRLEEEGG